MEECNYKIIGKKQTIEFLLNGKIDKDEMDNIYIVDMGESSVDTLGDYSLCTIMECIEDKNVMFFQLKEDK